jgi:rRNA maturation endonuclease Nob1
MVRRVRENRSRQYRIRCAVCGMEFEDRTPAILPRCPRCGSLNERDKLKVY